MQVIVGLGNPGKKYDRNRHNVGFKAIDLIAKKNNFGPWRRKFQSKISEGLIKSNKILLVKPETYMNNSGFAIKELFLFFKLNSDDLVVIHDDLDLKVGKIKAKVGGGHAGHNGLRSIDQQISTEYLRLRIGIDRPVYKSQVANYVLSNFSEKDNYTINNIINLITSFPTASIMSANVTKLPALLLILIGLPSSNRFTKAQTFVSIELFPLDKD